MLPNFYKEVTGSTNFCSIILEFNDKSGNFEIFLSNMFGHLYTKGVSFKTFQKNAFSYYFFLGSLGRERN